MVDPFRPKSCRNCKFSHYEGRTLMCLHDEGSAHGLYEGYPRGVCSKASMNTGDSNVAELRCLLLAAKCNQYRSS